MDWQVLVLVATRVLRFRPERDGWGERGVALGITQVSRNILVWASTYYWGESDAGKRRLSIAPIAREGILYILLNAKTSGFASRWGL